MDPLKPLWDIGKPAMYGHFWPQKGLFGPPCAHDWRMAMAKTASNQLGICLRIMHVRPVPKVSIFMAVTTKKVTKKAQKWAKMARFWPKTRYNGRVMAREIFFHQCLWVTKFCAKFGRSQIPRTARMHNTLIVLPCMWKEPAPLEYNKPASFWARSNNEYNHLGRPPQFPDSVCILKWKLKLNSWIFWKISPELCDCSTDFSPYPLAYTSFAAVAYNI